MLPLLLFTTLIHSVFCTSLPRVVASSRYVVDLPEIEDGRCAWVIVDGRRGESVHGGGKRVVVDGLRKGVHALRVEVGSCEREGEVKGEEVYSEDIYTVPLVSLPWWREENWLKGETGVGGVLEGAQSAIRRNFLGPGGIGGVAEVLVVGVIGLRSVDVMAGNVREVVSGVGMDAVRCKVWVYDGGGGGGLEALVELGCDVVLLGKGGMKWRVLREWLSGDVEERWVMVLDEDVDLRGMGFGQWLRRVEDVGLVIAMPALARGGSTHVQVEVDGEEGGAGIGGVGEVGEVGEVVSLGFVECGPATLFSRRAWGCVREEVLQRDLATGYGYDLVWSQVCAGEGRSGVVRAHHPIPHLDTKSASAQPNFAAEAVGEGLVLFERMRRTGVARNTAQPDLQCSPIPPNRCRITPNPPQA